MNILDKIIARKKKEVAARKKGKPEAQLSQSKYFGRETLSLKESLLRGDKPGIIAEIKRKSPSKGMINENVSVEKIAREYLQAGASALSVLTDFDFFGGKNEDLMAARQISDSPILRKDFIIDEYQLVEAKSIGADVILLIAAALTPAKLRELAQFARSLHLEVLMEVHNETELKENLNEYIDLVGVNNRDLKTFHTDVNTSMRLSGLIPEEFVKISESGISDPQTMVQLRSYGYKGFLIGGHFMEFRHPGKACREFITALGKLGADNKDAV